MYRDLETRCWSNAHWLYIMVLGAPMVGAYVIGIPMGLYLLLRSKKHLVKETEWNQIKLSTQRNQDFQESQKDFHLKYAFLYDGYKKPCYYWEIVMV